MPVIETALSEIPKRRARRAWALTAWANHGFATTVLVGFFPIFLGKYWAADLPATRSTLYLGLANSSASLVVMLLAPWLGAYADRRGQKKLWLGIFTCIGVAATAMLAAIGRGEWQWALPVFAVASVGFFAGSSFQDALIVQVATPAEAHRVSAYGFAAGYLGGGLLLLLNVLLALHPGWFGVRDGVAATRIAFLDVAIWWALFTLPLFRHVPEAAPTAEAPGWAELWGTIRKVLSDRTVRGFLFAYWLYIDGIGTLQQMAVDFGSKLGLPTSALIQALLLVQFISFPSALVFGRLGDRIGARRAILIGLAVFVFVSVWALFLHSTWQFYAMAVMVGTVQGGVQSLSRSLYSKLIPRERSGEYFGFYNMLGKFAAVLGPVLVGVMATLSGSSRVGVSSLMLLFGAGAALLWRVRVLEPAAVRS
ncbi:MAG TPA: MFS transporter [Steroidobacteraceae bacterium]